MSDYEDDFDDQDMEATYQFTPNPKQTRKQKPRSRIGRTKNSLQWLFLGWSPLRWSRVMASVGIVSHLAIIASYCSYAIAINHIARSDSETLFPTVWVGNLIVEIKHFDIGAIVIACCAVIPLLVYIFVVATVHRGNQWFSLRFKGSQICLILALLGAVLAFGITTGEAMTTFGIGSTLALHADFGPGFWVPPIFFWGSLASSMVIRTNLIKLQQSLI